ncbi:hypothetical protein Nepgr_008400 [Nepenthes gracilis]|uniref:AAA+ ATPase domain-containing protein n=1 Tax=Nepenthes gracilis TaxID=150966 RepID=A0AAD3S8N8_NEPGR|nr:hypothetical protein Nepgr_008400 [Nepenthes gracilis]
MAKRNSVVLLSSDDEDISKHRLLSLKSKLHDSKCSKSSTPARRYRAKATKKARHSDSCLGVSKEANGVDQFKLLCEDFAEDFAGFKVSAGFQRMEGVELWVDKYRPCTFEELAVNKKKVEEVKSWFEERLKTQKEELQNHVLLIVGPAGVGKSAIVYVVASHFGATVCEWNTPTPTIWKEHVHNLHSGIHYISKLDEFENFVERARKYGLLSSSIDGSASKILLIDDLPMASGKVAHGRLSKCLQLLVKSARVPTLILITDYGRPDSPDASVCCLEELSLSLQNAGACKVTFNPITVNSIKRLFFRICRQEQCNVTSEQIDLIANASGGDIRHAITSLQYFCLKPGPMISGSSTKFSPSDFRPDVKSNNHNMLDKASVLFARDQTLSLFHALGKFLHNKRETENTVLFSEDSFPLKEGYMRLPLKMDAPEKVLCQAYGQARPVAEFLHENVLDFLGEEAIEDAWAVTSYMSDADCLLSYPHWMASRSYEAENIAESAAASVAVRGVLFGNAHPSPSRWHAIRRPKLWTMEKIAWRNKSEMERQRRVGYNGSCLCDAPIIATDYQPMLKWLGFRVPLFHSLPEVQCHFVQGHELEDNELDCMSPGNQASSSTDDEIEDCPVAPLARTCLKLEMTNTNVLFTLTLLPVSRYVSCACTSRDGSPSHFTANGSVYSRRRSTETANIRRSSRTEIVANKMTSRPTRSSRLPPVQQEQPSRAKWTMPLTKILAELMVDEVHKGNRQKNSFNKNSWKYLCDEFCNRTGMKWDIDQLKSKYIAMRKLHANAKSILDQSDFSWDEMTGAITSKDDIWDDYIKEHPDAEALRSSGCPIYRQLCKIFAESGTNQNFDGSIENGGVTSTMIPWPDRLNTFQDDFSTESEDGNNSQAVDPIALHQRKRGRKGLKDMMAGAILKMAAASKLRAEAIRQCNDRFSITHCVKALDEVTGIDDKFHDVLCQRSGRCTLASNWKDLLMDRCQVNLNFKKT